MPSLADSSDQALIDDIKQNSSNDSILELIRRHQKLVFSIYSKYVKKNTYLNYEDLVRDSPFVLNQAVQSFNKDKNTKFSTWLANMARYYCLNFKRKNEPELLLTEPDKLEAINHSENRHFAPQTTELAENILEILGELKDQRIKRIFELRYYSEQRHSRSWLQISKTMGLSPPCLTRLHEKGKKIIREKLKSEN